MHPTAATDPHRLARAFLALADDAAAAPLERSLARALAAFAAALVLALGAPLTWTAKLADPPAATLANVKAVLADDDEDRDDAG